MMVINDEQEKSEGDDSFGEAIKVIQNKPKVNN